MYAMMTSAVLMRGAMTAVSWFAPATHPIRAHAILDDALAWIEIHRPGVSDQLRDRFARVLDESARRTKAVATG